MCGDHNIEIPKCGRDLASLCGEGMQQQHLQIGTRLLEDGELFLQRFHGIEYLDLASLDLGVQFRHE